MWLWRGIRYIGKLKTCGPQDSFKIWRQKYVFRGFHTVWKWENVAWRCSILYRDDQHIQRVCCGLSWANLKTLELRKSFTIFPWAIQAIFQINADIPVVLLEVEDIQRILHKDENMPTIDYRENVELKSTEKKYKISFFPGMLQKPARRKIKRN